MDYEEKLLNELTHIKHREELNSGQHTEKKYLICFKLNLNLF
jgi:hypothetical protein